MDYHKKISVFLYSDYPSRALQIEVICENLNKLGINAQFQQNYYSYLKVTEEETKKICRKLSSIQIANIEDEDNYYTTDSGKIENEYNIITGKKPADTKILYEGRLLESIYYFALIEKHPDIVRSSDIHIVYTSRLFCTFGDRRYHARVILTGLPSLISTSGLVEAPAKPREYYWLKASFIQSGKDIEELNEMFRGRFIDYDDPRITKILYSYTLQAIVYNLTGEGFCTDTSCCLYNSHWQEQVLSTQLKGALCETHQKILRSHIDQ